MTPQGDSLTAWVVGALSAGILGVLAFLARAAFDRVLTGLASLETKLDGLRDGMAKSDVAAARLEQRHASLELRVAAIERSVERISEGGK